MEYGNEKRGKWEERKDGGRCERCEGNLCLFLFQGLIRFMNINLGGKSITLKE